MVHVSQWCEIFPTRGQKACTVAKIVVARVFRRLCAPTVLHAEHGPNFKSNAMNEVYGRHGHSQVSHHGISPAGDDLVQRQNRTVQEILATFVSSHKDNWDLRLDLVPYAFNTCSMSQPVLAHTKWFLDGLLRHH